MSHISNFSLTFIDLINTKDPLFSFVHEKHSYSDNIVDDALFTGPIFKLQIVSSCKISLPIKILKFPR